MTLTRLTTLAIVAGCAFAAGAWAQDAASRAEFDRVLQEQVAAMNSKNWTRLETTLTDDTVHLEQAIPAIRGRASVMRMFQGGPVFTQMESTTMETGASGDLGYAVYHGSHLDAKGVKQSWHGVSVLKRVDRQWKVMADASMSDAKQ